VVRRSIHRSSIFFFIFLADFEEVVGQRGECEANVSFRPSKSEKVKGM
jgi:hypothetical protein